MGLMATIVLAGFGMLVLDISDRVPSLRVEQGCRAAAGIQMADSQPYDACVKDEMSARGELVQSWATFTGADRERCTGEASIDGIDSYVDLLVCLQMSRDAEAINRSQLKGARRK
jgi:hypothetical protein